jgi:hypothetical protein
MSDQYFEKQRTMRNLLVAVALLTGFVCAALPNVAQARTASAAIGVSVTVVSSCSVTAAHLSNTPVNVSCSYNTPFSVAQAHGTLADLLPAGAAAVSSSRLSAASNVTITTVTY